MPTRELPARPNLEQLKKQAKSLLADAQARRPDALRRFAILPALSSKSLDEIAASDLALHDAQSAVAREYGYLSWNALREEVESRTLSFEAALDEFIRCATGGAPGRAERFLALHPRIATATLQTALVLGDAEGVDDRLRSHPELATQPGGPQNWEPLLYVCHTSMHKGDPARLEGLITITRRLCALGANPNAEYHWNWHPELPRTALWAAICAVGHLPLAVVLLEAGANPTDGVTAHIAGGGGNLDALELLARYGMNVDGIPGGVPPLVYMMQWADTPAGPQWFLEHGADANLAWGDAGEAPLHVAARRWDVPMVEGLVKHGGDISRRRADGATPHTVAELSGNPEIAAWLLAHGAVDELTPLERFIAACARGRSRRRRRDADRAPDAQIGAQTRAPPHASPPRRERQRARARDDARLRVRAGRQGQGWRHPAASRGDGRSSRRGPGSPAARCQRERSGWDVRGAAARVGRRRPQQQSGSARRLRRRRAGAHRGGLAAQLDAAARRARTGAHAGGADRSSTRRGRGRAGVTAAVSLTSFRSSVGYTGTTRP